MLTFNRKYVPLFVATIVTYEITYFTEFIKLSPYIYFAIQCLMILYCAITLSINGWKVNIFDIGILLFILIEFISTTINGIAYTSFLRNTVQLLVFYFVARYGIRFYPKQYVHINARVLLYLTLANTISAIIVYPDALYDAGGPIFLLGGDNTSTRIYILAIMFVVLDSLQKSKRKWLIQCISLIDFLVFAIMRDLGTGKLCAALMIIGTIVCYILEIKLPKRSVAICTIGHGVLFVILVIVNKIAAFSYLLVDVLHRDLTLTYRTIIWETTLEYTDKQPLFGYGFVDGKMFESILPAVIGVNAHNTFLMITYIGGIVLLISYLLFFLIAQKKYDSVRHNNFMAIMPITLFVMLLRSQVEGGDAVWVIYLLYLVFEASKIEKMIITNKVNNLDALNQV